MKKHVTQSKEWLFLILLTFLGIYLAVHFDILTPFYEMTLVSILINMILAVGLNVVIGISGQFSLGHAGFMAIGAYAAAIVTRHFPTMTGLLLGIVIGMLLSFLVSLLIGIPTLRLKGDYLAIATLGFSEIIRIVLLNTREWTNGAAGLSGIPYLSTWIIAFICAVGTIIVSIFYIKSNAGRVTLAVREDETAAQSLGIATTKYKMIAFSLGAVTAALAGAIHATYYSVINPEQFGFMRSVDILILVVFGGMGSITGSVLAALILGILNVYLQPLGAVRMILYALILIILMVVKPSGLMGTKEWTWKKNKTNKKHHVSLIPKKTVEMREEQNR